MLRWRDELCFEISKRFIHQGPRYTTDESDYGLWRDAELREQWKHFECTDLAQMDVLDLGCSYGSLSFIVAELNVRSIVGVDIVDHFIRAAKERQRKLDPHRRLPIRFVLGTPDEIPVGDAEFDFILAFDMLEHLMEPLVMLEEMHRVLRPGGKVLAWWSPFRGPYGPHMEALVPIPWAHVFFGERAMFRAAERIYDLPSFHPNFWDLDENGAKLPNKWKKWSSFSEQAYVNELTVDGLRKLADQAGFETARLEAHGFQSSSVRKWLSSKLLRVPTVNEYFTSYLIVELRRPS